MKKYLTKRNIYIALFTALYLMVGIVSLIHSFAFFGLANSYPMAVMLGVCFEIGQVAVLMSLLTSKKEQGKTMNWIVMGILTIVQILGNVFSSYKYLMTHSVADLRYFKEPVFVWTTLPDNITTVIITYIVGGILPLISLFMCGLVSNYIIDTDPEDNKKLTADVVANVIDNKDGKEEAQEPENIDNKKIKEENDHRSEHSSKDSTDIPIYNSEHNISTSDMGQAREEEKKLTEDNDKQSNLEQNEEKSEDAEKEEKSTDEEESKNKSESERNVTNHFVNI